MVRGILVLSIATLAGSCQGAPGGEATAPAAPAAPALAEPAEVLVGLEPATGSDPQIDPAVAERLVRLSGEVGQLEFPSTNEVIERCRDGDASACNSVGTRLMHGTWGLEQDQAAAVPLFTYACDAGELEGCHSLAVALEYGRGVDQDEARAAALFERACDGEHVVACSFHADAYRYGRGVERDPERALAITERACLLGAFCRDVPRHRLSLLSEQPDAPFPSPADAAERACAGGDPAGCWWQALQLGGEPDDEGRYAQVETLLEGACDVGYGQACDSLGFHFLQRRSTPGYQGRAHGAFLRGCALGVGCDHLESCAAGDSARVQALSAGAKDDEEACEAGRMDRCLLLAIVLKSGNGVDRDPERAARLFEQVCEAGDPHGCWYLGGCYRRGEGVPMDEGRTTELYRRACDADHANGCVDLAFAHVHGRGVPQDLPTAIALFDKACTLGTACDHAEHYRQLPAP